MVGFVSSQDSAFYASDTVSGQSKAPLYLQLDRSLSTTPVWSGSCREGHAGVWNGRPKSYRHVTNQTKDLIFEKPGAVLFPQELSRELYRLYLKHMEGSAMH